MFQFPRFPSLPYLFRQGYQGITPGGFPHSGTPGSTPACGYPRHFVACHALLRLPAPRHPPCALCSLTSYSKLDDFYPLCAVFKVQTGSYISADFASCISYARTLAHHAPSEPARRFGAGMSLPDPRPIPFTTGHCESDGLHSAGLCARP